MNKKRMFALLTAVFMAFYCPKRIYGFLKPCTELLAGIPSIVSAFSAWPLLYRPHRRR